MCYQWKRNFWIFISFVRFFPLYAAVAKCIANVIKLRTTALSLNFSLALFLSHFPLSLSLPLSFYYLTLSASITYSSFSFCLSLSFLSFYLVASLILISGRLNPSQFHVKKWLFNQPTHHPLLVLNKMCFLSQSPRKSFFSVSEVNPIKEFFFFEKITSFT